jgi:hypothetical protein
MICRSKIGIEISLEEHQVQVRSQDPKFCLLIFMNRHTKAIHIRSCILPSILKTLISSCPPASSAHSKCGLSVHPPQFFNRGYEKVSVNYVNFCLAADKPYLVTTGDDKILNVWDYLCKAARVTCKQLKVIPITSPSLSVAVKTEQLRSALFASKHVVAIKACILFITHSHKL